MSIGLPFFALAANNPLMQAWFARTRHPDAQDPYFLYAASNIGSFLALLSYPILFEPVFTLQAQSRWWSIGFLILIALIAGCGVLMLRNQRRAVVRPKTAAGAKPGWLLIGRWVFISAVPSGLLVAVTAYISTDIAAAPLLWVIPLSLYLLTWILVFQRRALIPHRTMLFLQPFAIAGIVVLLYYAGWIPLLDSLAGASCGFFHHRHGLPRRARADTAGAAIPDDVLRLAVFRRNGRRLVFRLGGTLCIFLGGGISDPRSPGCPLPSVRTRELETL